MLMVQYNLTDDGAFGLLVRTSSYSNMKLRDIAVKMVADANAKAVV
jgi:AmiR/NasT family two-component response regulator